MSQTLTAAFATKPPSEVFYAKSESPAGPILVGLTPEGDICRLDFLQKQTQKKVLAAWQAAWPKTTFAKAPTKLEKKASGLFGPRAKDISLLLVGTEFQHKVWAVLLEIPEGFLISYAALAARAVGGAVGANPVPILVPCHRVIATDGTLGGYSGGLKIKKALLTQEGLPD